MSISRLLYTMLAVVLMVAAGCGGGGNGGASTVAGVAAAGAPIIGIVYLKDSANPAHERSATIASDGSFKIDLNGLEPPYLLKAVGTISGGAVTMYSFASSGGTTNINPLAQLTLIKAYGSDNLANLYNAPNLQIMQLIEDRLPTAITAIQTVLQPTLAKVGATTTNFISGPYVADHQGLDLLFDMVDFSTVGGILNVSDHTDSSRMQACLNDLSAASVNEVAVTIPPTGGVVIWPASATIEPQYSVQFSAVIVGNANQQLTWSVVEESGGIILDNGLYLSPMVPGTYHVKATNTADPAKYATATITTKQQNVIEMVPIPAESTTAVFSLKGIDFSNVTGIRYAFSFDPEQISNPVVTLGSFAAEATLTTDNSVAGRFDVIISGKNLSGSGVLASVSFDVQAYPYNVGGSPVNITRVPPPPPPMISCPPATSVPAQPVNSGD